MDHTSLTNTIIFITSFLGVTALLSAISRKTNFPYTVALLTIGFIGQFVNHALDLNLHLTLNPNTIFFVLLPLLLFESAMHINIHQFKLQFKTITFLATIGLLLSIFITGFAIAWLTTIPLGVALLFGAMISATDPIAVLALFKTLGAPKRLSLLAEGESMFNDATAVIAFRIIAGFVVISNYFQVDKVLEGVASFFYIFAGSIALGIFLGWITSQIIAKIDNDRAVETTLTLALGLGSFAIAEHFFGFSGVITTVIAGLIVGNYGRTKISAGVVHFIEEVWEYLSFLAISLIFFFTAFNLNFAIFSNPAKIITIVVVVLVARAVSVYASFFFSNTLKIFQNEPNVLLNWQHVINWGGLRGVIPLVLVFSLPDTFAFKQEILGLALATFLFTLFVNGLTIKALLTKLGLHLPKKEEEIINHETNILRIEQARNRLRLLPKSEFNQTTVEAIDKDLKSQEKSHQAALSKLATAKDLVRSLNFEAINIERNTIQRMFLEGHIKETVLFDIESELDLQQDALEYPQVTAGRSFRRGGRIDTRDAFRKQLLTLRNFISRHRTLSKLLKTSHEDLIYNRYSLLKTRIITSQQVISYLNQLKKTANDSKTKDAIGQVKHTHRRLIAKNQKQADILARQYPQVVSTHQRQVIHSLIKLDQNKISVT